MSLNNKIFFTSRTTCKSSQKFHSTGQYITYTFPEGRPIEEAIMHKNEERVCDRNKDIEAFGWRVKFVGSALDLDSYELLGDGFHHFSLEKIGKSLNSL